MRVAFFGSGALAVPVLARVATSSHELVAIVTQPARPAGRGGKLRPTPVREHANVHGLDVIECPNVNTPEAVEQIKGLTPDVICVVDFGQMVRQTMREAAPLRAFNVHASLLPLLRGAAPVNWAIIEGHDVTGVTTFDLVDGMDAGAMYVQRSTEIRPHETAVELKERLGEIGAQAACETLDRLADGHTEAIEQDHSKMTLAPKMSKSDGVIGFAGSAASVCCRILGTWPWPGGQATLQRAEGKDVSVVIARAEAEPAEVIGGVAGVFDDDLLVQTGSGRVRILEIKPAGKKLMAFDDFVNGYRVAAGDRFVGADEHAS
jgi:methionyl-tRNA formyltransferase